MTLHFTFFLLILFPTSVILFEDNFFDSPKHGNLILEVDDQDKPLFTENLFPESSATDRPRLELPAGKVSGEVFQLADGSTGIRYLGIPYAKPPTGKRRFKVLQELELTYAVVFL